MCVGGRGSGGRVVEIVEGEVVVVFGSGIVGRRVDVGVDITVSGAKGGAKGGAEGGA